jgi:hypothetical protein
MRTLADIGLVLFGLGLGWAIAWRVAWRALSRRPAQRSGVAVEAPWRPGRPEAPLSRRSRDLYTSGAFPLGERFGARTWAVCDGERWALSYELDGTQRLAGWIDETDVPLELRLSALQTVASREEWR